MGATKLAYFRQTLIHPASLFKALGHPARMAIVTMLAQKGTLTQDEIDKGLPLSKSTNIQHLHVLCRAGVVYGNDKDIAMPYRLSVPTIKLMKKILGRLSDRPVKKELAV